MSPGPTANFTPINQPEVRIPQDLASIHQTPRSSSGPTDFCHRGDQAGNFQTRTKFLTVVLTQTDAAIKQASGLTDDIMSSDGTVKDNASTSTTSFQNCTNLQRNVAAESQHGGGIKAITKASDEDGFKGPEKSPSRSTY